MRRGVAVLASILALSVSTASPPALAVQFGGVVFDPSNYGQNLLTAARTLRQVSNQIRQLQNEARMLANEARNLTSLTFDAGHELQALLGEIDRLMATAQAISFEIAETDRLFEAHYPEEYAAWTASEMATQAEERWAVSRDAFHDTLRMQSAVVDALRSDARLLDRLVAESQSAAGDLSATQAGNQITALAAKQSMQLQSLMAAQYRAEALERARRLQTEREAPARHERFSGSGSAYAGAPGRS